MSLLPQPLEAERAGAADVAEVHLVEDRARAERRRGRALRSACCRRGRGRAVAAQLVGPRRALKAASPKVGST